MSVQRLALVLGVSSATSLGYASVTEPQPVSISLNGGRILLLDEGGQTSWKPVIPSLKNGGLWTESVISDGRQLINASVGNVTETLKLVLTETGITAKGKLIAGLGKIAQLARDFHTTEIQPRPVYLAMRSSDAPGPQYSLVYNVEIASELDIYQIDATTPITLTIEREPYWRGLPPGDNPKLWSFYYKGWAPLSTAAAPGANLYNYLTLPLTNALANHESLTDATIYPFDEIGTSNVNYIDIPAALIPGDVEALALVNFKSGLNGISKLHVARSTRTDFFPANNNNNTDQRARITFNGGDCTPTSSNPTVSRPVHASGVLSQGSIVNRYVLQLVYAAGTISSQLVATWSRVLNQYPGKYAAFIRGEVSSGAASFTKFWLEWTPGGTNINRRVTTPTKFNQSPYGLTYLGVVDFTLTGSKYVGALGRGVDLSTTFDLRLVTSKSTAETSNIKIWDIVLIPIDEPNGVVILDISALNSGEYTWLDATGYFMGGYPDDIAMSRQSSVNFQRRFTGQAITLKPGVANRLYFLPDATTPAPTTTHEIQIDIVPRWTHLRDY